jgi:TonB-linked SusC/RagA family outer membrane protein
MKSNFTRIYQNRLKSTILLWIMFFIGVGVQSAYAQSQRIQGKVTNENGEGLPGLAISIKGTSIGTITDVEGTYQIEASPKSTLVFSSIGYETREVLVGNQTTINLQMVLDSKHLEEIVIVGYGESRKKDLTGSVSIAEVEDMQKAPVASFEEAFAGRVAGVNVTSGEGQPGDQMNIVIRGMGSITQSTSPLFVIDGIPIENPPSGVLDPSSIESISVLKDASAAAIYGSRGSNGVIIVTTKGGKEGSVRLTYDGYIGVSEVTKRMDLLSPYEFVDLQNEIDPEFTGLAYLSDKTLEDYKNEPGLDWQDEIFQQAAMQSHKISIGGGSRDNTLYSIDLSAFNQEGVIINSGFDRYIGKIRIDQRLNDRATVGAYINYSRTKQYGTRTSVSGHNFSTYLLHSVLSYRPVSYDPTINLLEEEIDPDIDPLNNYQYNPILSTKNEHSVSSYGNIILNAFGEYELIEGLTLKFDAGYRSFERRRERFNNSKTRYGSPNSTLGKGPNGWLQNQRRISWNSNAYLTYNKKFAKIHKLRVMAGTSVQERTNDSFRMSATQVELEGNGVNGLDSGVPDLLDTYASRSRLLSYFGRAQYSIKDKYLLTATIRRDGSSKFANKWGTFPSAAFAWQIGDESFMDDVRFISDMKLRASWGQLGNNRVSDYASKATLTYTSNRYRPTGYPIYYAFNNVLQLGVVPQSLENTDLRWEVGEETNFGFDVGFFENRFNVTVDAYRKTTKNLLLNAQLPSTTGYRSAYKNIGSIENKGLELAFNSVNLDARDFKWTSTFNISFNKNKVLGLNEGQTSLPVAVYWTNMFSTTSAYISKVGQPVGQMYGYVWDGVYQYDDFEEVNGNYILKSTVPNNGQSRSSIQPGYIKYKDINGDGQVNDNDRTVIGNPNPKHYGGFGNNFSYKNLSLHMFFQWSYGSDVLNANRIYLENGRRKYSNMFASVADRWRPESPSETMHSAEGAGLEVYSSRLIEDGSFLRLKTVSLSYNLPNELLSRVKMKAARVYFSAQNLYTWDNYSGYDPEVSVRNSALTAGFDFSAYPRAQTYTLGLSLTL